MSQVLTRAAILNANKMQAEVIGELRAQVESLTAKLTNEHDVALTWHRHNMELAARNMELKAQVEALTRERDEANQYSARAAEREKNGLEAVRTHFEARQAAEQQVAALKDRLAKVSVSGTISNARYTPAPSAPEPKP